LTNVSVSDALVSGRASGGFEEACVAVCDGGICMVQSILPSSRTGKVVEWVLGSHSIVVQLGSANEESVRSSMGVLGNVILAMGDNNAPCA